MSWYEQAVSSETDVGWLGLAISPCKHMTVDLNFPLYCIRLPRLASVNPSAVKSITWKDIYLVQRLSSRLALETDGRILAPDTITMAPPFRFREINNLLKRSENIRIASMFEQPSQYRTWRSEMRTWDGKRDVIISFKWQHIETYRFTLHLGLCQKSGELVHWAKVSFDTNPARLKEESHDCSQDHIRDWNPLHQRSFTHFIEPDADPKSQSARQEFAQLRVTLTFSPCKINPAGDTLSPDLSAEYIVMETPPNSPDSSRRTSDTRKDHQLQAIQEHTAELHRKLLELPREFLPRLDEEVQSESEAGAQEVSRSTTRGSSRPTTTHESTGSTKMRRSRATRENKRRG